MMAARLGPENALIVVDIQRDFLPTGALPAPEGDQVIAVANRLMERFSRVVASQDWHPPDHGSFAANHPGKGVGDVIDLHGLEQILWPVHCVQNTPGAEFADGLDTSRFERVFRKGVDRDIDSYSTIYDNGHRRPTGMGEYLKENGVTDLWILGLATDYCVKFTTLDALKLGFRVCVIEDACRGVNVKPGDVERAVEEMRAAGAEILRSATLLSRR